MLRPYREGEPSVRDATLPIVDVCTLTDGAELDQVFMVREVELRSRRDGGQYLRLVLGDCSGSVQAVLWDGPEEAAELARAGQPLHVVGRFAEHPRYGNQVTLRTVRQAAEGTFDRAALVEGPARDAEQMESDLVDLIATVQDDHFRTLLGHLLGPETKTGRQYRHAPAAKHYHQAYEHGLLEHSLTVAQAVSAVSAIFPGIDRDLAVTGALIHDIGKLDAYTEDPAAIDLTDAGRLQGEIPLGYFRVRTELDAMGDVPAHRAQALLHVLLSHHGSLQHGSPVVPATREATLVHFMDNLGGRLGSFDRLEKGLPVGAAWSTFDRALGASAFFGEPLTVTDQRDADRTAA